MAGAGALGGSLIAFGMYTTAQIATRSSRARAQPSWQVRLEVGAGQCASATISGGIAVSTLHGSTLRELVHQADQAMYTAKQRGKNQVLPALS